MGALLDEGLHLASVRTFYRVLGVSGLLQERRAQLVHPAHVKPELVAAAPNQVWSWDITRLRSAQKWQFFYLYVLLEHLQPLRGRVAGGQRRERRVGQRADRETCAKYGIARDTLTLHSDRGSPMRAKTTAELLVDLGVAASFSRPRVSNDNPFSESQFKTLKYRPEFPPCFEGLDHARTHLRAFFGWYNDEHRHSGIGFMTPAMVHFGQAPAIDSHATASAPAYAAYPERFKGRLPTPPAVLTLVGITLPPPQPHPQPTETRNDVTTTPALLTNFHNEVSQSH